MINWRLAQPRHPWAGSEAFRFFEKRVTHLMKAAASRRRKYSGCVPVSCINLS